MTAADATVETLAAVNLVLAGGVLMVLITQGQRAQRVLLWIADRRASRDVLLLLAGVVVGAVGAAIAGVLAPPPASSTAPVVQRLDQIHDDIAAARTGILAGLADIDKRLDAIHAAPAAHDDAIHAALAAHDNEIKQALRTIDGKIDRLLPLPAKAQLSIHWATVDWRQRSAPVVLVALQNTGNELARIEWANIRFCPVSGGMLDSTGCIDEPNKNPGCSRTFVCERDLMTIRGQGGQTQRHATVPSEFLSTSFAIDLDIHCTGLAGHDCGAGPYSAVCARGAVAPAETDCTVSSGEATAGPLAARPSTR